MPSDRLGAEQLFLPTASRPSSTQVPSDGFHGHDYRIWNVFIDVNGLNDETIPINANVRKPALGSVATDAIESTLASSKRSARFWAYNGGLVILASGAKIANKRGHTGLQLTIPPRYGLVNGGHTQLAIKHALEGHAPTNSWIRVEVIVGEFTNDEIADIAEARNTSRNVRDMSIAWKKGKFDSLQRSLPQEVEQRIDWTENLRESEDDEATCNAEKLIQLLMLFDTDFSVDNPPKEYASSLGRPFNQWSDNTRAYRYLNAAAARILELHDNIKATFHQTPATPGLLKCKWGGKPVFPEVRNRRTPFYSYEVVRRMDDGVLFPLLSAFRVLLEVDSPRHRVRWRTDPVKRWDVIKGAMMTKIKESVQQHSKALEVRYDWNLWTLLAYLVQTGRPRTPTNWESY